MKYISIEALRTKRQNLIDERNAALQEQNYELANKLLKEIKPLTIELNNMLKKKPRYNWL